MNSDSPRFAVGQTVCLSASRDVVGVVVEVTTGGAEPRYVVFNDGSRRPYYESQLAAVEVEEQRTVVDANELHARLSATHITQPGISSLYTLHAGRIDFVPYQFRPVLKLIRADRPRLLIADEVGVGKTIEAGLILRELQARQDLGKVLIVCSKSLIAERKWETEMRRFDEEFTPLDGPLLRHCLDQTDLDGDWPERYSRVLLPFSLFSENLLHGEEATRRRGRRVGLLDLDPPPRFDLVIVDEAHHLRNPETYVHQGMRFFADNANAVIFLTATPLQMGDQDLFVLLNMLRPDYVLDPVVFEHMSAPNGPINRAIERARNARAGWNAEAVRDLEAAAATNWGQVTLEPNPEFQALVGALGERQVPDPDRVRAIRQMEEFHSFSSLINRTRRRDIGQFTTRKPVTQTVPFTPEQQALHDAVLQTQASILARLHTDIPIGFLMTTIRRQAASCLHGLAPLLREILTRRFDDLELSEIDPDFVGVDTSSVESIRLEVEAVLERASRLPAEDPKWSRLDSILTEKRALENRRVLLFSSFRHTLAYLERKIRESGHRAGVIHGDTPDEDRRELRRRFALGHDDVDAIEVLLCSEVGSEGLDYQFCDCIVNYDLPWNPMRIEQRIGRIDRYGQQSEAVAIHNLVTPGTVDFDIYDRCLVRLGIFREAIGGSEEILGRITTELRRIAEDLTLSDDERRAQLQQMADNEIRVLHEQAGLEERQLELFGVQLPQDEFAADVERARNPWLEPWALRNLIETYARTAFGVAQAFTGEGPQTHLRLNAEARQELLRATHESGRATTLVDREWRHWLKSGTATAPVAFERSSAAANRNTMFITPAHPLARIAARSLESDDAAVTCVRVRSEDLPQGEHHFVIYLWHVRGVRDDAEFRVVCDNEEVESALPELLRESETCDDVSVRETGGPEFENLEARHHQLWSERRTAHARETKELVEYRLNSLRTSHAARIEIIREQIAQATDTRIRRMREAEQSNAEREHRTRVANLEAQATAADVLARPVAYGLLRIEGSDA